MKVIALTLLPDNRTQPGMIVDLAEPIARLFLDRGLVRLAEDPAEAERQRKRFYRRRDLAAEDTAP